MTSIKLAACIVVAVAVLTPARAIAAPRIDLTGCAVFDADTLAAAIARELPPLTAAATSSYRVVVQCTPDNAWLHVAPLSSGQPIALAVNLDEVPPELRIKLLALAVAELAQVVVALPAAPGVDAAVVPGAYRHAPAPAFALALRFGARVLPALRGHVSRTLGVVGLETNPGRFRFGIQGIFDREQLTGRMTLVVATGTFGYDVYCARGAASSICFTPRAECGLAYNSFYAEVGVGVDAEHRVDGIRLVAGIVAGWEHPGRLDDGIEPAVTDVGPALDLLVGARW